MILRVNLRSDTLYFRLGDSPIVESEEVTPGIVLDYGADDKVIAIEVLSLSKRVPADALRKVQLEIVQR